MTEELFRIRDAREDDQTALDVLCAAEGMDAIPSTERVRVAVNDEDEVVGFIRIAVDEDEGTAFVNPVITHDTWRGYGVGRALMDEALAVFGELRLVSRGQSLAFYDLYRFFGHKITRFLFENPVVFPISSEGAIP